MGCTRKIRQWCASDDKALGIRSTTIVTLFCRTRKFNSRRIHFLHCHLRVSDWIHAPEGHWWPRLKDQAKLGKNCMLLSLKKFLGFGLVGGGWVKFSFVARSYSFQISSMLFGDRWIISDWLVVRHCLRLKFSTKQCLLYIL